MDFDEFGAFPSTISYNLLELFLTFDLVVFTWHKVDPTFFTLIGEDYLIVLVWGVLPLFAG